MTSVLAIAETDSYAAWADGLLRNTPDDWTIDRTLIRFPTNPSERQLRRMLGETSISLWDTTSRSDLRARIRSHRDHIVLLACRGEMVELLAGDVRRHSPEALIVNGICGPAQPMSARAVAARLDVDVFVAHSLAERNTAMEEFRVHGGRTAVGLATLPVLVDASRSSRKRPDRAHDSRSLARLGFVDQDVVPVTRWDRVRLVQLLDGLPRASVSISRRTIAGEESTHRAIDRLDDIVEMMTASGVIRAGSLSFDDRPVLEFLDDVDVLLTVSSTVGLEAIAAGCPVGFVTDFGVNDRLRNRVFQGSGVQVRLSDLKGAQDVPRVDRAWADQHYFHSPDRNDWLDLVRDRTSSPVGHRSGSGVRVRTRLATSFPRVAAEVRSIVNRAGTT